MTAVPRGKTGVSMRPVTQRGPGLEEGESEAVKASEVTNGKEARLVCGCIGTKSSAPEEKPVFWINHGCGDGGVDHHPGSRPILEPDDEVRVLGNYAR